MQRKTYLRHLKKRKQIGKQTYNKRRRERERTRETDRQRQTETSGVARGRGQAPPGAKVGGRQNK